MGASRSAAVCVWVNAVKGFLAVRVCSRSDRLVALM